MINRSDFLIAEKTNLDTEQLKGISFVEYFELYSSAINEIKAVNAKMKG